MIELLYFIGIKASQYSVTTFVTVVTLSKKGRHNFVTGDPLL